MTVPVENTPGTDLAVIDPSAVEAAADPAQYVVQACERAKTWLAHALEYGDIEDIVELKSQAEAIRIYTMQKQLGKDAELSAAEIVRRAERGLGLAIRKGQAAGEIASRGASEFRGNQHVVVAASAEGHPGNFSNQRSPKEFFSGGKDASETYAMTDGVTDEEFEDALDKGRAERNLSRVNVVRKVREVQEEGSSGDQPWIPAADEKGPQPARRRRELIREWARQAWTSTQIGDRLGLLPDTVRRIARDEGIAIPADEVMGRGTRKTIDSNRIVRETVNGLEGLEISLELVDFDDLDHEEIENWTVSLTTSIRVLNRLNKRLKEMVQ